MSDPRFQPRLMAAPPDRRNFGKNPDITWLEGSTKLEASRIAAARLQHAFAVTITGRLRDEGYNIRSYAKLAGIGYERMAKVLRGEVVMRLEDVSDAEMLLGGVVDRVLGADLTRDRQIDEAVIRQRRRIKLLLDYAAETELVIQWERSHAGAQDSPSPDPETALTTSGLDPADPLNPDDNDPGRRHRGEDSG